MKRLTNSPLKYVQCAGALSQLCDYASIFGKTGAFAVVDSFILENYETKIKESFTGGFKIVTEKFVGESSKQEVDRISKLMEQSGCDVVVGIGGGKTLDTAKAVGYYANVPVVIAPTAASTDAPCSALSVLYTENGQFDRYLPLKNNPNVVLVDTEIIANAPVRYLVAGMGDALATYYEARSCKASGATSMAGGVASVAAMALAAACRDTLFDDGFLAMLAVESKTISPAVENIIEVNTYLSGIGFESAGLAAAHAIHNGLTVLEETHKALHGEKVAFGTIVHLVLEKAPLDEIMELIEFCRLLGLPTSLAQLGVASASRDKIMAVAKESCAEGDTMGNMPFPVTPEDVCSAILVTDKLGRE